MKNNQIIEYEFDERKFYLNNAQTSLIQEQDNEPDNFRKNLEKRRWFIFIFIALASYSNCGQWIAYTGVQRQAKQYYDIDMNQFLLFVNSYMICFPIFSYFAAFILHWNFKYGILFGSLLNFTCAACRYFVKNNYQAAVSVSFLAGISQVFTIDVPVYFAQIWFHSTERIIVVTILVQITYFANATLYMLSPLITGDDYKKINDVNFAQFILALVPFVMGWFVMKNKPDRKPNATADIQKGSIKQNLKKLIKNKQYLISVFMFGINIGHSYTICPAIEIILKSQDLSPKQIGLLGFTYNMMGIFSGLAFSLFLNKIKESRKYFDRLIKIFVFISFICLIIFGLMIQFIDTYYIFVIMSGIMGFFMLSAIPQSLMAIDEASFPADENIAQNGVFLLGNLFSFFTLLIFGIETLPKLIKCHLLTIIYIPCFIYVVFFYKTTFNKSDREGLNSSFN